MSVLGKLFRKRNRFRDLPLDRLIEELSVKDSADLRSAFYQQLLVGRFLLPTASEQNQTLPPGCPLTDSQCDETGFLATTDPEGKPALLVFTDIAALSQWRPENTDHAEMLSRELFAFALSNQINSLLINPGDPSATVLRNREIMALSEGILPTQFERGIAAQSLSDNTKIAIGRLSTEPSKELVDMVCQQAAEHGGIQAVYLAEGTIGNDQSRLIIGLQLAVGTSTEKIMDAIAGPIQSALAEGERVDFLPFSQLSSLSKSLSQQMQPIFQRTT